MQLLIIFREDKIPFNEPNLKSVFSFDERFCNLRSSSLDNVLMELEFAHNGESAFLWIDTLCESIGIRGFSDASLTGALAIQEHYDKRLSIVCDAYGEVVGLADVNTIEELAEKLTGESL